MKKKPGFPIVKSLVVSLNFIVVIALIFSLLAGQIPPSSSTLFSAFGLLYPILLIANALFVILWALVKSRILFVSLAIILIGYPNLISNFQLSSPHETQSPDSSIKILSYNIELFRHGIKKYEASNNERNIISFIQQEEPDIVCLQEYFSMERKLRNPLMPKEEELNPDTYYSVSYFSPEYRQLEGLVIFSKYKLIHSGNLKFKGSRVFGIYTDLIIDGDTIRVFNIHFASIRLMPDDIDFVAHPEKEERKAFRLKALKIYNKLSDAFLLREKQMGHLLAELQLSPYPIILCGDFNDTPSSFVYNKIISLLEDTFTDKGNGIGRTYAGELPLLRIDFILKSHDFITLNYKRHKIHFSDHFPVSVKLKRIDQ